MRAVWILVAVAIVAAVAWYVIRGQEGDPVVSQPVESEAPASDATDETAEEQTDDASDAVEDAVEQVQDAVNEATEDAEAAVNEVIEGVVEEANDAVGNAAEGINNAVSDVLGTSNESSQIVDTASADTGSAVDDSGALSTALSVDGFDPELLKVQVEESTMSPVERLAAKVLIEQAEADPGKIETVIAELKKALNVE
ncbi:MAG: hypothetical protein ACR2OY_06985 [Boseongicola sp.]